MDNKDDVNMRFAMDGYTVGKAVSPQRPKPESVQKPQTSLPKGETGCSPKSVKGGV